VIHEIVTFAYKARKEGIVSLDNDLDKVQDPFLRRSLMLAVDGTEPGELRKMMELELEKQGEYEEKHPKSIRIRGGFSPTIGIIGAILGLIQVMQHLDNIEEVGKGIAVAFVATIYGVGAANLLLLPAAGKLKIRMREEQVIREMMLEGVIFHLEGMNPRMIETKLYSYLAERPVQAKGARSGSMRKKRMPEHVSHERWLVSYADFITLLFAFFVVLYASSQVDKRKAGRLAQAIQVAFQELGVFQTSNTKVPFRTKTPCRLRKFKLLKTWIGKQISRRLSIP